MKKYISRFLKFLIRQTLYVNLHFLYAYLITKATLINHSKNNDSILVFGRVSSDMDLLIKNTNFNYYYLHRLQFFIPSIFLDKKLLSQRNYFNYQDNISNTQKTVLRKHLLKILRYFKKHGNLQYIFTASFNYFEHQEWANAGKELGIELIVYYKESVISEGRIEGYKHYISDAAKSINNVDKILVYGETGLKQLEDTNLVDNNAIIKIGSLKTDELFNQNKKFGSNISRNAITLYAFPCDDFQENFNANTYYSQVWQAGYWAPRLWKDTINLFTKMSNKYKDTTFIVKTKSPTSTEAVKKYIDEKNFENLVFTHELSTYEVYEKSSLVIGFNSTVLIEMLSTDVPCLIPQWHESKNADLKDKLLLNNNSDAYNSVNSAEEFTNFIEKFLNESSELKLNIDKKERDKIVNYYLYSVDGKVIERLEEILNAK